MTDKAPAVRGKQAKKKAFLANLLLSGATPFPTPIIVPVNESYEGDSWCD